MPITVTNAKETGSSKLSQSSYGKFGTVAWDMIDRWQKLPNSWPALKTGASPVTISESLQFPSQPRPQGLLAFQYDGGSCPATPILENEKTLGTRLFRSGFYGVSSTWELNRFYCPSLSSSLPDVTDVAMTKWRRKEEDNRRALWICEQWARTSAYKGATGSLPLSIYELTVKTPNPRCEWCDVWRLATPPGSTSPTLFEQWCGFFYVRQEPDSVVRRDLRFFVLIRQDYKF